MWTPHYGEVLGCRDQWSNGTVDQADGFDGWACGHQCRHSILQQSFLAPSPLPLHLPTHPSLVALALAPPRSLPLPLFVQQAHPPQLRLPAQQSRRIGCPLTGPTLAVRLPVGGERRERQTPNQVMHWIAPDAGTNNFMSAIVQGGREGGKEGGKEAGQAGRQAGRELGRDTRQVRHLAGAQETALPKLHAAQPSTQSVCPRWLRESLFSSKHGMRMTSMMTSTCVSD